MWRKTIPLVSFGILASACLVFWFFRCSAPSHGPQEDGRESDEEKSLTLDFSQLCPGTQRELQAAISRALGESLRRAEKDPALQREMKLLSYIDDTFPRETSLSIWLVKPGNRWEVLRNDPLNHDGTETTFVVLSGPIEHSVALIWRRQDEGRKPSPRLVLLAYSPERGWGRMVQLPP